MIYPALGCAFQEMRPEVRHGWCRALRGGGKKHKHARQTGLVLPEEVKQSGTVFTGAKTEFGGASTGVQKEIKEACSKCTL